MYNFSILITLLFVVTSFAQSPEKEFLEISPEQEKKIQEIERKKADFLKRKQFEEKKKLELAKIAAQKKADELKKLDEERKKKEELEAYTKWLISERDRKMKESSLKADNKEELKAPAQIEVKNDGKEWAKANPGKIKSTKYKLAAGQEKCLFEKPFKIPANLKVVSLGTYEGSIPWKERGFQQHPMTDVTINLTTSGTVALMFWTYEPIRWKIKKNSTNLRAVFVMGYHRQIVEVDGETILVSSFVEGDICKYSDEREDSNQSSEDRARKKLEKLSQNFFGKSLESFKYIYRLPPELDL